MSLFVTDNVEIAGEGGRVEGGGLTCREGWGTREAKVRARVVSSDASAKKLKCSREGRALSRLMRVVDSDQHERVSGRK